MNLTTTIPNDLNIKSDNDTKSNPKPNPIVNHQKPISSRSFGRELGNLESQNEVSTDASWSNSQSALDLKENYSSVGRGSLTTNENVSEKSTSRTTLLTATSEEKVSQNQQAKNGEPEKEELNPFDIQTRNNPQYVVSHVKEVFTHLRETEERHIAQFGYISKVQGDVNERMRAILVDWLVDVHIKFKLCPETLFLACNIVDRYLEQVCVTRQKLQLVGISSMLIASKYEDIYPPEIKELEYVTDKAYNREEILEMEGNIINRLKFNFTTPSSLTFLQRFALVDQLDEKMMNMCRYLLELALVDYKMLKYTPSTIACSSIYLINKIHKKEGWSCVMAKETKYLEGQLRPCAKDLCALLQGAAKNSFQAVKRKYSASKYMQVSKIQLDKV